LAAAILAAMAGGPAAAADMYWDTNTTDLGLGGSGFWNTSTSVWSQASNGTSGPYIPWNNANADNAIFGGTAGTVTIGQPIIAHDITFSTDGYAVNGTGANTLTLAGPDTPMISVAPGVTGTIGATVAGTNGLEKAGGGILSLSGANTFSGGVNVTAGTLRLAGDSSLGAAGNNVTMAAGTALTSTGALNSSRVVTLSGGTVNVSGAGAGSARFTGAGGMGVFGGLVLTNDNNDFTGATVNNGTGLVSFTSIKDVGAGPSSLGAPTDAVSGTISLATFAGAQVAFNYIGAGDSSNRNFALATDGQGTAIIRNSGTGALTLTGNITTRGVAPIQFNAQSADLALLGNISPFDPGNPSGQTISFTGAGNGHSITVSGSNTYAGPTTIQNVAVIANSLADAGAASSLGTGSANSGVTLNTGTLTYVGTGASSNRNFTLNGSTAINSSGTGAVNLTGPIAFGVGGAADTLTLGGSFAGVNTIAGTISNPGSLIVAGGPGDIWQLNAANTFTGNTTVSSGTLRIGNTQALGTLPQAVAVNGGTLDLNGTDITVASLTGTGGSVALNAGDLTVNGTASTAYSGTFTGDGGLVKAGTGTLTLSGQSTYTGATTVNGGTLALNFAAPGAPASNILSPASTLNMTGGTLTMAAGATTATQKFASTQIAAGSNTVGATTTTGGNATIDLGAISHTGGLVNFNLPTSGSVLTSSPTLGGWATVNGTDYADVIGGAIVARTAYANEDIAGTWSNGQVVSDAGGTANSAYSGTTQAGTVQLGGLKYTAAATSNVAIGGRLGVDGTIIVAPSVGANNDNLNGGQLTGPAAGGTLGILQNSTGIFTVNSTIVDSGGPVGFTKAGTGQVTLTGSNTYTGPTTISGGVLSVNTIGNGGQPSAIGASSNDPGNLVLENGTLQYTSATSTTSDRGITLVSGGPARNIEVTDANANLAFGGQVTSADGAGLTKTGPGTLTLSNAGNNYVGATVIAGGTLAAGTLANGSSPSSIGASGSDSANLALQNGGTLNYLGGTTSTDRGFTLSTGGGIGVNDGTAALTVSGTAVGTGPFTKTGPGTLILSGTNTYTGGTVVSAGTMQAGSAQAFGTGAMTVASGASLNLNNFATTLAGLNGGGNVALGSTGLLTISGAGTYSGIISGGGGLLVTSAQSMSGCHNTYTGATSISGGSLTVSCLKDGLVPSDIGASSSASANLSISNGGQLVYTGPSITIDRGLTTPAGPGYVNVADGITLGLNGLVTGAGALAKAGNGVLVLGNPAGNNYTGGTSVVAGVLRAAAANAFGTGTASVANVAGATLDLAGFDETVTGLAGGGTTGGEIKLGAATLTTVGGNQTFGGVISGTGSLVKSAGALGGFNAAQTLSGCNNSYTGSTTVRAGWLSVNCLKDGNVNSSIGASSNAASNLVIADGGGGGVGATLSYTGAGDSTDRMFTIGAGGGALDASGTGALVFRNTAPIAMQGTGNRTFTLTGINTGNNTLAAQIVNPTAGGVTALTKTGTGTWILTNPNSSYTGITTVSGGVLGVSKFANGGQLSSIGASSNAATNLVIGNNSRLRYTGTGDTTDRQFSLDPGTTFIESSGTGAVVFANTGNVTLNGTNAAHTLALGGTNTGNNTMGGTIADDGTGQTILAKNDSGTWVLTGNNTYTGNTVVNDGTLVVGNGGTSGNAGAGNVIVFNPSSTLAINRTDTFNFSGTLSGPGALEQRGSGTTQLTAVGNSIGATRITNGTLQVDGALTTSTLAMSNTSALTVNGTVQGPNGTAVVVSGDGGNSTVTLNSGKTLRANGDLGDGSDTLAIGVTGTGPAIMDTGGGVLSLGAGNDKLVLQASANLNSAVIDGGAGTDTIQVNNSTVYTLSASSVQGFEALNKTLAGPLFLTGNQTYSAGVTIAAGTVQVGDGSTPSSLTANVVNNGTLAFNVPGTYTFGGTVSGTGGLRKIGAGTTILTGTNSYGGPTAVNVGTLLVDGDQTAATGATTVASGATLGGIGTIGGTVNVADGAILSPGDAIGAAGTLNIKGDLQLGATSALNVNFGQANVVGGPRNDLVAVGGNLTLDGAINVSQSTGGTFGPGLYRIISYSGTLNDQGATVSPTSDLSLQTAVANQVNLVNTTGATLNFWDGDAGPKNNTAVNGGAGTWRAAGDDNWTPSDGIVNGAYANGGFAVFAGTGGTVAVDNTNGQVQASGMQFAANGYTVQGAPIALLGPQSIIRVGDGSSAGAGYTATIASDLSGTTQLAKTDLGTLVLSGTNTYTGGTLVDDGTLRISADANLGDAAGRLTLDGATLNTTATLAMTRTVTLTTSGTFLTDAGTTATLGGAISGAGGLVKQGAGTLVLDAAAVHTGGTTVSGGTLQVGAGGTTGTLAGNVVNNATLAFDRGDTYQFDGTISGTGALAQNGTGMTVLTANNTYTGGTTINAGALQLGNGGTTGMIAGNVSNNGMLSFNRSDVVTFNGTISGTGAVSQDGAGTTILTAANSYGGATTVNNGTLLINGDQTAANGITTVNAGTLGGTGTIGGTVNVGTSATLAPGDLTVVPGILTVNGDLNLDTTSTLAYNFGQANVVGGAYNDLLTVGGNVTLDGAINVTQSPGGNFGPGLYRVVSYAGTLNDQGLVSGSPDYFVQTSIDKQVNLVNTAGLTLRYWDGEDVLTKNDSQVNGGNGTWQGGLGNDNWTTDTGTANAPFQDASFAVFAGTPGMVGVDNTAGSLTVSGMQFATDGYTIQNGTIGLAGVQSVIRVGDGTLAGAGYTATIASTLTGNSQLVKTDLGKLVLSGTNTYTGGTEIDGGTVSISSDANLGDVAGALTLNGGTLQTTADFAMTRAVNLPGNGTVLTDPGTTTTWNGAIGGAGALIKQGAGRLVLGGDATHTGGTTIAAGTLQVGAGGTTGSLAGNVDNSGTLAFDRSDAYRFDGAISGTGAVDQNGTGTTILAADNSYTGGTTINAGTLQLGAGGTSGMIAGNVANNGTLAFNRSDAVGFGGTISGTGGVSQDGGGTTTLTAANSYTGSTTVNAGTLLINGDQSAATGTTTVNAGTLGGAGTVGGDVSVAGGATLAPGAAPGTAGTLAINGNLSLASGAVLDYDFGQANAVGGAQNDLIRVAGDVTLGGTINVTQSAGGSFGPGVYRVISYSGNLLGGTLATGTLPGGSSATVQTSIANQVNLVNASLAPLTFWDGDAGGRGDGAIAGGNGTWRAASDTNWTSAAGDSNGPYTNGGFPIFAATPGTVTVDGSVGTVSASGMQFATSGYTVQGDAITLTGGDATIRVGDGTADGANYVATINAPLTGSAGLTKTDLGTLVLGGTSSYTGATNVAGGTLVVNGSIASSAVTAQAGTTLAGTGTVGAATIASGATVAPGGNTIGTLTVSGDYAQQGGATYQAQVDPASTASDRIAVTGTATLGEGAVINVAKTANTAYVPGTRYTVLSAAGGVHGAFTLTGDTALSAFIGLSAAYDANNAYLAVQQSRALDTVAQTSNQASTARGVDSLPVDNAVKTAMLNLPDDASARGALNQLSGEIHASVQTASIQGSHFVRDAATDRMREAFCGVGSEGDRRDLSGTEPRADTSHCGPETRGPTGWARVFGGWQHTDSNGNAGAMDDSTSGILVGVDTAVSENWRVGVMTGYSHSDIDVDSRNSSGSSDNYHVGVYGGAQWGALGLRTGAAYTWQDISTSRSVNVGGFSDHLSGDYNAGLAQVYGDLGYRIDAGRFSYEPFVNVAYVNLDTDSFTEKGGAAALHSPGDSSDVTFSTLGMRGSAAITLGSMQGTLRGSLGWRHAFGDDTPVSTLRFQGGQQFGAAGVPIAQDAAVLEAGVDMNITKSAVLGVSYGGQFAGSSIAQSVQATLRVRF
jgi:fibronectin-binding autotransporter adhesin